MDVVVPQHDSESTSILIRPTQNIERGRASIDEIANEPQRISLPVPLDAFEQPLQGQPAAVNVTDSPRCHHTTLHAVVGKG